MINLPNIFDDFGNKLTSVVSNQFPKHFIENDSSLVYFFEVYYEWLYTQNNHGWISNSFSKFNELNKQSVLLFWDQFKSDFLSSLPDNFSANNYVAIKTIKSFYLSKGSILSFKFIFKLLYNVDIQIDYPKNYVFKTSASKWVKTSLIKLDGLGIQDASVLLNRRIYGRDSNFSCTIESVNILSTLNYSNVIVAEVSSMFGQPINGEIFETRDTLDTINCISFPQITKLVAYANPSLNVGSVYTFDGLIGKGCIAKLIKNTNGLCEFAIIDSGQGYNESDVLQHQDFTIIEKTINTVYNSPGKFVDTIGHCSSYSYIQDGNYWQDFSYVIKSSIDFHEYKNIIEHILHPAGTKMFGELNLLDLISYNSVMTIDDNLSLTMMEDYIDLSDLVAQYPNTPLSQLNNVYLSRYSKARTSKIVEDI